MKRSEFKPVRGKINLKKIVYKRTGANMKKMILSREMEDYKTLEYMIKRNR